MVCRRRHRATLQPVLEVLEGVASSLEDLVARVGDAVNEAVGGADNAPGLIVTRPRLRRRATQPWTGYELTEVLAEPSPECGLGREESRLHSAPFIWTSKHDPYGTTSLDAGPRLNPPRCLTPRTVAAVRQR